MNVVLSAALLFFGLFVLFYALWSFFILYHLIRFSPRKETALVSMLVFVGVTAFLLIIAFANVAQINWEAPLTLPTAGF